jgi:titin
VTCGVLYSYRVRAFRSGDGLYSDYTAIASATAPCPPAAPSLLSAQGVVGQTHINLTWMDNSSDETTVYVERSTDRVNWTQVAATAAETASYQDTAPDCYTTYSYRVRAYRSGDGQYSMYSNVASAQTSCTIVYAPTGLTAIAGGIWRVDLSWIDNSPDETNSHIERSLDGTTWAEIAVVPAGQATYRDSGAACGRANTYRVRVFRSGDSKFSAYSNTAGIFTQPCSPPGAQPVYKPCPGVG